MKSCKTLPNPLSVWVLSHTCERERSAYLVILDVQANLDTLVDLPLQLCLVVLSRNELPPTTTFPPWADPLFREQVQSMVWCNQKPSIKETLFREFGGFGKAEGRGSFGGRTVGRGAREAVSDFDLVLPSFLSVFLPFFCVLSFSESK